MGGVNTREVNNLVRGGDNREGFLEVRFDLNFEDGAGRQRMCENKGGESRNNTALGPEQLLSCVSRTCKVTSGRQSKAGKSTEAGFHRPWERTGALLQKAIKSTGSLLSRTITQ